MPDLFLHRNGGGVIRGVDGAIGSDCYLSPDSEMRGRSFISCASSIRTASIIDTSTVVDSEVEQSMVLNSQIHHANVSGCALDDVVVRGANGQYADLFNVILSNEVVVENCRLRDFELSGCHLVHSDWDRTPPHYLLETESGVRLSLMKCSPHNDRHHCGCKCEPFSYWNKKEPLLRRYFTKRGWDLETFNGIRDIFESWRT